MCECFSTLNVGSVREIEKEGQRELASPRVSNFSRVISCVQLPSSTLLALLEMRVMMGVGVERETDEEVG